MDYVHCPHSVKFNDGCSINPQSMEYVDGVISSEGYIVNEYMERWADSFRFMNNSDDFGDRVADELSGEYAHIPSYVVQLDNGQSVDVPQTIQCMQVAQVGDRVRICSKTGSFDKGNREYYNLSRGPPPMKPLKRYINEVHKGGDGCDYQVGYEVKAGNKQGRYVWRKKETS